MTINRMSSNKEKLFRAATRYPVTVTRKIIIISEGI